MKFSNFLFPDSRDPERDGVVIDETLREAWLSDELGVDVIWLAEHHFDGICAYADPISFAGALATSTRHSNPRRFRPPRQVLEPRCPDAAAAAVYKTPPTNHPRRLERGLDARARAAGPPVPDERAINGSNAAAHGTLLQDNA